MKIIAPFHWLAAAFVLTAIIALGEDSPRSTPRNPTKGEAIIFSGKPLDSSATNITVGNPKNNLKLIDDEIRKPFDFFNVEPTLPNAGPPSIRRQQQMIERVRRSQERMKLRPEDVFFDVESKEDKPMAEDPYSLDPEKRKPKSSLERYYERLEREQAGVTNQFKGRDLLGDKKKKNDDETVLNYFGVDRNKEKKDDRFQINSLSGTNDSSSIASSLFSLDPVKPGSQNSPGSFF